MTRQVFVIWTHPIFHESVRLLLNHPDVEWVGATSDYAAAKNEILSIQPDTILIEDVQDSASAEMMEILKAGPQNVRVIGLSLADNELSVYHRERRTVGQAGDLLRLILCDSS
jgi:DNA-binding NarL/FixJ family response regulator